MARIDAFLKLGVAQGCSDLHLAVGVPPMLRMHGDLMPSSSASPSSRNLMGIKSPCMRNIGGTPTARCRSEQPWATPNLRNASILAITR